MLYIVYRTHCEHAVQAALKIHSTDLLTRISIPTIDNNSHIALNSPTIVEPLPPSAPNDRLYTTDKNDVAINNNSTQP